MIMNPVMSLARKLPAIGVRSIVVLLSAPALAVPSVAAAGGGPLETELDDADSCPAFERILDDVGRNKASGGFPAGDEFDPGAMAAMADCMVRGALESDAIQSELRASLQNLWVRDLAGRQEVDALTRLLNQAGAQPARAAAAFFAANSMLQVAEASRLLDTPLAKLRVTEARGAVVEFARSAAIGGEPRPSLQESAARVAGQVDEIAKLGAVTARRDMAASVAVRLKTFSRRNQGKFDAEARESDSLFAEANAKSNMVEAAGLRGQEQREEISAWTTGFDTRLMAVVRRVSPQAQTPADAVEIWHAAMRREGVNAREAESLVELAPDQMRSEIYETAQAIRLAIPEVRKSIEQSSGLIDRSMIGFTAGALASLRQVELVLDGAAVRARRTTSPDELVQAWKARDQFRLLATWTLEAAAAKSRTSGRLASVFAGAVARMWQPGVMVLRMEDLHEVHGILEDQNSENWVRAFVNRRMAVVYAQSALLLGEAISVPFTWGASGAAMPVTLNAIVVGLQVAGKATLVVVSSMNIADRFVQQGVKSLVNPASALDALTIVMLLPRPVPGPVDAQTWFGRALQTGRNSAAGWMHEAGRFAVVGHTAFGAYQLAFADHIAATLRLQGYQSSAAEVRRQAIGHFAQAFLLGIVEWGEYRRGQALGGDHHTQVVAASNPVTILLKRLRNMVFPHKAAIDAYQGLAPVIGAPLAGVVSVLPAAGYLAYDYVIASEAMMYFYAGTDFGYFAHNRKQQEYPELAAGETAVSFIGFDEADMLYAGARAIDAHRVEMEKYGKNYFIYDYHSREEFLRKLADHARDHGPVKYLRVMTHGLPGKLYTADVQVSAGDGEDTAQRDGWIDAKWLRRNGDRIRGIAAGAMAPGARAVLFACLVGANMDSAAPGLAEDAGDDFLRAMGETIMHKGGLVDASVRFLIGLDTVYGSMLNWAARDEVIRAGAVKHQPVLPLNLYREGKPGIMEADETLRQQMASAVVAAATGENMVIAGDDWAQGSEMLQYAVSRMWRMLTQLHKLGIRYGIQLEGPWWSTPRYKHAHVEPAADSATGVNVRITQF